MRSFPALVRPRQALTLPLWGLLAVAWVDPVRAVSPEQLEARFREEAPGAWEQYQAYADQLQGSEVGTRTVQNKPYSTSRLEFKSNKQGRLMLSQSGSPGASSGTLRAFNALYGFTLTRKAADAPWALRNVRRGDNRYDPKDWENNGWTALYGCVSVGGDRLGDLIRQSTFRVLRAGTVGRDGRELAEIEFDNAHRWSTVPYVGIQGGTLLLDPDRFWTLRSFTLRLRNGDGDSICKGEYELRDPAAKYPVPKRSVLLVDMPQPKESGKEGRLVTSVVIESDLEVASHAPADEEFTLSAFGLPEPQGVTWPTPTRWYLWFIAAGVCSLAVGGFFWHRVRARKSEASATP